MSRIVFLVEEPSMVALLNGLLPRFFPGLSFLCVPHEGKQDLERSIPRKLRAWWEPEARFVVVRDNDGSDCMRLKQRLLRLCQDGHREDAVVRIACQELEAWYFGDPDALATAFGRDGLRGIGQKARYRDPDSVVEPSRELKKLVPEFQKISGARRMAKCLRREQNRSRSFQALLRSVEQLCQDIGLGAG